jgi:hypothetical protein
VWLFLEKVDAGTKLLAIIMYFTIQQRTLVFPLFFLVLDIGE